MINKLISKVNFMRFLGSLAFLLKGITTREALETSVNRLSRISVGFLKLVGDVVAEALLGNALAS